MNCVQGFIQRFIHWGQCGVLLHASSFCPPVWASLYCGRREFMKWHASASFDERAVEERVARVVCRGPGLRLRSEWVWLPLAWMTVGVACVRTTASIVWQLGDGVFSWEDDCRPPTQCAQHLSPPLHSAKLWTLLVLGSVFSLIQHCSAVTYFK